MIEIFEGRLGSYKTYSALIWMMNEWMRSRTIFHNIDIRWADIKLFVASEWGYLLDDELNHELNLEQIGTFHEHTPDDCKVVIDEGHLRLNARDWNKTSRDLLDFLTLSRHHDTDVLFISQHSENMDKQIRRLVQYYWRFRDLEQWQLLGLKYPLTQYLQCQYDYDGHTLLNRRFLWKDPRIYGLYNSKTKKDSKFSRLQLPVRGAAHKIDRGKIVTFDSTGIVLPEWREWPEVIKKMVFVQQQKAA